MKKSPSRKFFVYVGFIVFLLWVIANGYFICDLYRKVNFLGNAMIDILKILKFILGGLLL